MNKELSCQQVIALLNFYIEGKLNPKLCEYIDLHIKKCPACAKKVEELSKIYKKYYRFTPEEEKKETLFDKFFFNNLSAYVDNELNINENIKIKKLAISNPNARKELESMYKFRQLLNNSYAKTKNDIKFDFSKNIISKIQDLPEYSTSYFYKLAIIFIFLIISIVGCFMYLYF